jgi:hypothetical protein
VCNDEEQEQQMSNISKTSQKFAAGVSSKFKPTSHGGVQRTVPLSSKRIYIELNHGLTTFGDSGAVWVIQEPSEYRGVVFGIHTG